MVISFGFLARNSGAPRPKLLSPTSVMDTTTPTPPTPNFARAVGRNTIVQFIGKIFSTVLGFATSVLILRYLHPEGNGQYTTAMAYLGFLSVVADLGLYLILVRDINKPGANAERIVGNLLALRWVSALVILLGGAAIVSLFGFSHQENIAVLIGTGSFIAVAATQLLVGVFQSKLAMIYVAVGELIGRTVLLGVTWWVVARSGSLYAIMAAVVISTIANFIYVWWSARRFIHIRLHFDWAYWRSTLRDTLPIAISIVLNLIYFRADTIILRMSQGTYDVGLYGAAYKVLEILNTFPLMFVGLLLPALGAAFASNDHSTFQRIFQKGFDLLLMAVLPLIIGGCFLAVPILTLIGGHEYAPAAPVFRMLLVAVGALFLNSLSGHTVTIINRQRQMVWAYLSVAVIGLATYLILIPRISLYGAATGTIVSESLTAILGYMVVLRAMRFRLQFQLVGKTLLAAAMMVILFYLLRYRSAWVAAVVASAGYLAMIFLSRAVSPRYVKELFGRPPAEVTNLPEA